MGRLISTGISNQGHPMRYRYASEGADESWTVI